MRSQNITRAGGVLAALLLIAVPAMGQSQTLRMTSPSGESGTMQVAQVLLDNVGDPLDGWSFGVCHDPAVATVEAAVLGANAAAVAPIFVNINTTVTGGVTMGVVIDFSFPFTQLLPGLGQQILDITYTLVGAPGTSSALTLCGTLGSPPVAVVVVANAVEIAPATIPGTLAVVQAGPSFIRGDANRTGTLDLTDAVRALELLFLSVDPLVCEDELDVNDSGNADLVDVVFLLQTMFLGAGPIPAPNPGCGIDPTDVDNADCTTSAPLCP